MRLIFLIIPMFCCISISFGQYGPKGFFNLKSEADAHREFYMEYALDNLNLSSRNRISNAYGLRINITKKDDYEKLNFDLSKIINSNGRYNYLKATLVSPLIIRGTIVKKRYHNGLEAKFHSEYHVKIEDVLGGELNVNSSTIRIMCYSGVTNKGTFVSNSIESRFFIGEEVILFLEPFEKNGMKTLNVLKKVGKYTDADIQNYLKRVYDMDSSKIGDYYQSISKISLKNNYAFLDNTKLGLESKVIEIIKKITLINNSRDFYKLNILD